jgi:hypothetical protein
MCCSEIILLWLRPPAASWRQSDGARIAELYEKEAAPEAEIAAQAEPPSYDSAMVRA